MSVMVSEMSGNSTFCYKLRRLTSKKTSYLCFTGPLWGKPWLISGFPTQRASNVESASMSRLHHVVTCLIMPCQLWTPYILNYFLRKSFSNTKTAQVVLIAPHKKRKTFLSCIVNTMAVDDLAMQRARASAALVLIKFWQIIPALALDGSIARASSGSILMTYNGQMVAFLPERKFQHLPSELRKLWCDVNINSLFLITVHHTMV